MENLSSGFRFDGISDRCSWQVEGSEGQYSEIYQNLHTCCVEFHIIHFTRIPASVHKGVTDALLLQLFRGL